VNFWDEILTFLAHYTDRNVYFSSDRTFNLSTREIEMRNLEYSIILRLSAHIAIMMMLNGRIVKDDRAISNYNLILTAYIDELIVLKNAEKNLRSVDSIIFYISYLIGD
jgi:hypothetical protein